MSNVNKQRQCCQWRKDETKTGRIRLRPAVFADHLKQFKVGKGVVPEMGCMPF
jgi:hypothetical protein